MNDHVVDGEKLTEYVQEQYDLALSIVKLSYLQVMTASEAIAELNKKYNNLCKEFKITIEYA